jgi:cytochrome c oxidase cbb3-type subunit 3
MRPAGRIVRSFAVVALALNGCDREYRNFHEAPPGATVPTAVRMVDLQPGPPRVDPTYTVYEDNAWAISEGQRMFGWFNCSGCHAPGGGGSMGPPLIDDEWIYGSAPENIFATIQEGRPNGMPSFRGRIGTADTWKLVAYVRYLSERTPVDTWPGRADGMQEANPEPAEGEAREGSEVSTARRRQ